jgi:hypothetical protein
MTQPGRSDSRLSITALFTVVPTGHCLMSGIIVVYSRVHFLLQWSCSPAVAMTARSPSFPPPAESSMCAPTASSFRSDTVCDTVIAGGAPMPAPAPAKESKRATSSLEERIRRRAYQLYLQRGNQPGSELNDWLQAEQEIQRTDEQAVGERSTPPREPSIWKHLDRDC